MNTLGSQILTGLQVLALPPNILALLVGTLAGVLLGATFRLIGVSGAAALVLLMPVATALDPTTGLVLLGSCLTTALISTAHHDPEMTTSPSHHNIPLMALLTGLVVILASASAAAMLQSAAPVDTLALLVCGAAAAIILAAATHPAGWPAAFGLTFAGIALQLSPLNPLHTEQSSPLPLLFGLLVLGPAALALAYPARIRPWTTAFGGIELAATVLPAFLMGIPATRGISVFALDLNENGLYLGPRLMTQRPKLVLAFVVALVAAGLLGLLFRLLATRVIQARSWPKLDPAGAIRLAASVIFLLAAIGLYSAVFSLENADASAGITLLIASGLGALAAWFGLELAPLVTGLVIGQLMQSPLQSAREKAGGSLMGALAAGSNALLLLAFAAILAVLLWPALARRASR